MWYSNAKGRMVGFYLFVIACKTSDNQFLEANDLDVQFSECH